MINIAVLGYGTIGSGIVEVIQTNYDDITYKVGEEINVAYVLDLREFPNDPINKVLVHDYDVIINDPTVKIIAEAMGGVEPAYTFAKKALEKGKNFCTSNKELVAKHGPELVQLAADNNVNFLFEASVGGGIPIVRPLNASLTPEKVVEITGILNGTTNYMLTKMTNEGAEFDEVLKDAQEKGYAERNPEADIEGYDACRKIAILSSLAYGKNVDFEDIYTEGITKITSVDIEYAMAMDKSIKLLATSWTENDKVSAMVAPMLVGSNSPLYSVNDVYNAIVVKGNTLDDIMFYGAGAGKLPTASAVVSDIITEARNLNRHLSLIWDKDKLNLTEHSAIKNAFFVRVNDNDGAMKEEVHKIFGDVEEVSIEKNNEFAFVTGVMTEGEFLDKTNRIGNVINYIRIKR